MTERRRAAGYRIRRASDEDCDAILDIHRLASMATRDGDAEDPVLEWLRDRRPEHYLADMRTQQFVVAADGETILGFAALDVAKATVVSVFVAPESMRRGIGSAMMAELERMARDAGLDELELQAAGGAIEFYKKLGYTGESDDPSWMEKKKKPLSGA